MLIASAKDMQRFEGLDFHPVIHLPDKVFIHDYSDGRKNEQDTTYSIGKYNEIRPEMYNTPLFEHDRNLHVGIDIGGPVYTPIHAFMDGIIFDMGYNSADGDYGYTLITMHKISDTPLYVLHGHLSSHVMNFLEIGQEITRGQVIAWIGDKHENGGWEPHLHFQLSWIKPEGCDLPGVVTLEQRDQALQDYPDPRLILGEVY